MGAGFPLLYWYYGLTPALGISLVYLCLLTIIFVIDIEHQLILDRVVFPGMALALVFSLFNTELHAEIFWRPIYAAIGGGAGFTLMLIPFLVSRGGMGFGDVKMAALIGLMAGFPGIFISLFLAIISGGLAATALLILRRKKRREAVPFGPFLAAGAMLVIVWGGDIQLWYQQLIA
jgi:leader peptidase (prepilin peptidase)/N-methyltransferase